MLETSLFDTLVKHPISIFGFFLLNDAVKTKRFSGKNWSCIQTRCDYT